MTLLWESDALLAATAGRPVGAMPEGITGISIDTRTLKPGEAFFAIKGDRVDGHDYVTAAMKAGAGLAVVAEEKLVALGGISIPLVVVRDVLEAMRQLAAAARARTKARIIAVTGSVGKTTTKEMMRTVLAASGAVHASAASFNNHWGVPLTLARMPADTRFGVFEIGMNHPDEIRPLVKLVRPHVAVITNVAAAHLGAFDSVDAIAHAKAEIFEGVVPGGYGLINHDDKRFKLLKELAGEAGIEHLLTFGRKRGSDYRLKSVSIEGDASHFEIAMGGKVHKGVLNVPGEHLLSNLLAVLGVAHLAGADMEKSLEACASIRTGKGRGERHKLKYGKAGFTLIDESYNANPASMRAAIEMLGEAEPAGRGRRIAVLGDMLELGKASEKLHRELSRLLEENNVQITITAGNVIAPLAEALGKKKSSGHFADWKQARAKLLEVLRSGDVVMVKASNGLRFGELVTSLKNEFSGEAQESGKTGKES
ncbi:UDP-N-acetylmuramoylalanyl-D-glutamyl-2,6-diaminopimelate--D-alanyl-D-alanine ligase [Salaquimonas pukyongi]|uniref:UDP-N-acetylmuramoylalanyl-D-glutamyl-2, 6-diaminopimelate--D-alanyl-D-alanine ligase n=1 Tax=Salaquimonas pukyongi TaxID=2712698 RepID=UPI00096BC64B|nr:UDP-N-acetylmuramoylalanyl-D-glutamyl-2,6-diaminopimelate--D-alanyl-D-alanine ligase [Salaquimonas pukyongi]